MKILRLSLVLCLLGGVFLAGIAVATTRVFPYPQIVALKDFVLGHETTANPGPKRAPGRAVGRRSLFSEFAPDADVVMVGDSITEGAIWAEIFPDVAIANRGVWGDTTADVLARLDTITALTPDKAFVMLGVNDIRLRVAVPEIFANYTQIVAALNAAGAEVVVQSVLLCALPRCLDHAGEIRDLNARLSDYAQQNGHMFIDLNATMTDPQTGVFPDFTYDGIHLSGKGYAEWARLLGDHI